MPHLFIDLVEEAHTQLQAYISRIGDHVHSEAGLWAGYQYHVTVWQAIDVELVCRYNPAGHRRSLPFYEIQKGGKDLADQVVAALREECKQDHQQSTLKVGDHSFPLVIDPNMFPGAVAVSVMGIAKASTPGGPLPEPALWIPIDPVKPPADPDWELARLFPRLLDTEVHCPAQGRQFPPGSGLYGSCPPAVTPARIAKVIVHLNDHHCWTREQIADWLETLDLDLTVQPSQQGD